ncbi:hypothetical protein [Roseospira visakhapatnamensis]|uniref:Virus attachment protein p12 family protein n=1 Tax=Roseospira visakhapatnamensis TaxID=390880 RepID=A0A7W6REN1_9PROT|nr:hypothetical protein [Roseospira visakhapatnamensis]MBB4266639.1 hypothetical protein [Roseospira visakhapatnamensis]
MPETSTAGPSLPSPTSVVDLSHEAAGTPWEWGLVALAVALALAFLWRSYFGRRKPACASCGKAGGCSVTRAVEEIDKRP